MMAPLPPGDALTSFGWDVRLNRVVVRMDRLDEESIAYFRERVRDDALEFVFVRGGWMTTAFPVRGEHVDG